MDDHYTDADMDLEPLHNDAAIVMREHDKFVGTLKRIHLSTPWQIFDPANESTPDHIDVTSPDEQ